VERNSESIRRTNRPLAGGLMVLLSALMFAGVGALVKLASQGLSTEMTVFFRNAMAMAFFMPWLLTRHNLRSLRTHCLRFHLLRAAAGLSAMYCFFYALRSLRLADAVLLNYTVPIFIPVLARLWLREPVGLRTKLAVAVGFIGIAMILKPGFGVFQPAGLVGLASGILAAVSMTAIRRMSTSEPMVRIVFFFTAIGTLVSGVPLTWAWESPQGDLLWVLGGLGISGIAAQLFVTKGYSMAPAGQVGPFSYGTVVFAAIIGWLFWGEALDWMTVVGAVLTCSSGIIAATHPEPKWEMAGLQGRGPSGRSEMEIK
jgi:drug/metabolite transporter (DMT)-like permease